MESPSMQLPEGTSCIPLHPGRRGVALALLLTVLVPGAQLPGPTSSQTNPISNLCLRSSAFRQPGALQNQKGTNTQIFMELSRCRQGKLKFSAQVVYARLT